MLKDSKKGWWCSWQGPDPKLGRGVPFSYFG